jgi:hypothetical protein
MAGSIEHVSRHRLNGVELQVIADHASGNDGLIEAEKNVVRRFLLHGGWPHRRVNLFVFEDLKPVAEKLRSAKAMSEAESLELERKPMVHIYNLRDLSECSVFVNRALMTRLGLWEDTLAIEGLLAHEHAHPIAENSTTRAARDLRMRLTRSVSGALENMVNEESGFPAQATHQAVAASLEHLARELCIHASHEVFTNELAIRAGFGLALEHLNLMSLAEGRAGMAERARFSEALRKKVSDGQLSEIDRELLLLIASMEAHVRLALETAAFARAGARHEAEAIEARAMAEVFSSVEPEIGALYHAFYNRYMELTPYMDREAVREWAETAFAPALEDVGLRCARFNAEFYYENKKL